MTFNLAHGHEIENFGMTPARHGLIAGNLSHESGVDKYSEGINLLGAQGVLVSGNSSFNEGVYIAGSPPKGGYGVNIGTFGCYPPCSLGDPFPTSSTERVSILDNYFYDIGSTPSMLNALVSNVAVPVVVAGNTYAPMIGVADAIIYAAGSHNADNDDQP